MAFGGIMRDYTLDEDMGLLRVESVEDFCDHWRDDWRPIAVQIQAFLKALGLTRYAEVLGALITIADSFCKA